MDSLTVLLGSFLVAFPALFSIVNPLGGALIYSQVTGDRPQAERVTLAWRVAMYAALVMLGALLIGVWMMSFFGISIAALRIAGGLFLAAAGWEMLRNSEVSEDRKLEQAGPATGAEDVAFFPSPCHSPRDPERSPSRSH